MNQLSVTNAAYEKQLEQESKKTMALNAELEGVQGQTLGELSETCEAEYRFLDKLENQLSKNKQLDSKKIEQIKSEAKTLFNQFNKVVDD